jgi:hypothetical protein
MSKPQAAAREKYIALSSAISPALDPAATVLSINAVLDSDPPLVPVSRGPLWKLISDGTLETFKIKSRRFTTLAMIAACNKKLIQRGKNAPTKKWPKNERRAAR